MFYSAILSTSARQAFLTFTISLSLLKLMSIEIVMPSNHLILCHPLLLLPSVFARIRVFFSELVLRIRRPKYWSFSFSISPSKDYSGLISFKIDCFYHKYFSTSLRILCKYSFSSCKILYKRRCHSLLNQSLIVRHVSHF